MAARIEFAEFVSFRLRVPEGALERLVQGQGSRLSLELVRQGGDVLLSQAGGDCFLLFRPADGGLMLREVVVSNDLGGLFFQQVLGALMVECEGDLEVRLVWNVPERNTQGEFAEVQIKRGVTAYPGLSSAARALRSSLQAASAEPGASTEGAGELEDVVSPEDQEIERLLARARADWEAYLRHKNGKGSGDI